MLNFKDKKMTIAEIKKLTDWKHVLRIRSVWVSYKANENIVSCRLIGVGNKWLEGMHNDGKLIKIDPVIVTDIWGY